MSTSQEPGWAPSQRYRLQAFLLGPKLSSMGLEQPIPSTSLLQKGLIFFLLFAPGHTVGFLFMSWVYGHWIQSFPVTMEPVGSFQLILLELCKSLISWVWPKQQSADNVQCEMEASLFELNLLKVK